MGADGGAARDVESPRRMLCHARSGEECFKKPGVFVSAGSCQKSRKRTGVSGCSVLRVTGDSAARLSAVSGPEARVWWVERT